jgi:SAM-dependent methyltransferase
MKPVCHVRGVAQRFPNSAENCRREARVRSLPSSTRAAVQHDGRFWSYCATNPGSVWVVRRTNIVTLRDASVIDFHSKGRGRLRTQMGRWSRLLAPRFVAFTDIRRGARVLDVSCGTGNLSLCIAQNPNIVAVVGIDFSPAYSEYARRRSPELRISFDVGDACEQPAEVEAVASARHVSPALSRAATCCDQVGLTYLRNL